VALIWADSAIRNRWLQVTVRATDNTGLAANDVFYVGNAVGESGNAPGDALVNATDEIGARNNPHGPFSPALREDAYDFNRDKLVNATDQIIARNSRTSPFTALRLIRPPSESGGGGEGESEWSGADVWTSWTDNGLFEDIAPLGNSCLQESLVVPSANSSDLPRLPALSSVSRPAMSAALDLGTPSLGADVLHQDALNSLFALPTAPSATPSSDLVDLSGRVTTSLIGRVDLLAPMAASSPAVGRAPDVLQRPRHPAEPVRSLAWSQDVDEEDLPVGPVKEERSRDLAQRIDRARDSSGRDAQRTLDEALQELLAEWEQF
jgi:hypothetical protein